MPKLQKSATVLILTSTYPRWPHDTTPGFVADFVSHVARQVKNVYILAPHYKNALRRETTTNIYLTRFRYFFPASAEDIAYNGGAVAKIKKTPLYGLKLLCFMAALFFSSLFVTLTHKVTIINAHWLVPQGFVAVLVKFITRRKVIITIHGGDVLTLNGKLMRIIKTFTLRHADIVCVNSSLTKSVCQTLCNRDYQLIPMGIDIAKWQAAKASPELKKRYNLNSFTILFVGRFAKEKGVIYLLESLVKLQKAGKSFKALIVGGGPLEDELKTYIRIHKLQDSVTMVGWIDSGDLPAYYKTADIFVGPSLHEAQGLTFLEALAAGLPVITTDRGGTKDFVKDGENGLLVAAESSQALYESLLSLYDTPALLKKLKSRAASSVAATYSWDSVTREYCQVFERLLS